MMQQVYNPYTGQMMWQDFPPIQQQQQTMQQPEQPKQEARLVFVADEVEARAQRVPYGGTLMMMDGVNNILFIKKVDDSGSRIDFKSYRLEEIKQPAPADYALRSELLQLTQTVNQLASYIMPQQPQPVQQHAQPEVTNNDPNP